MRKLILALMTLACLSGGAEAQQQQKFTADQGKAGAAPWPVTWGAGLAVNADLRIGGNPVATGNPVPVSVGNAFALDATAKAGNVSSAAIAEAIGATADAATASGANTTVIGALRAIRDRLLATLTVSGTVTTNQGAAGAAAWKVDGSAVTQPVSLSALPLPAGAATAANQNIEIAQLTMSNQRSVYGGDIGPGAVTANQVLTATVRDGGGTPSPYVAYTASFISSVAGTGYVQCSDDNTTFYELASQAVAAPTAPATFAAASVRVPYQLRYCRTKFVVGSTGGTLLVKSGFMAN